jgi:hypothetical protein
MGQRVIRRPAFIEPTTSPSTPESASSSSPGLPLPPLSIQSMPSQTHSTLDSGPSTSPSDDEVLVRVEGVSKKFCRSLKKSLWYGVCDIAGELLPGRKRRETRDEGRELSDRSAQDISRSPLDAGLSTAAASALDSTCSAKALDARLLFRSPCGRILRRQRCLF